MVDSVSVRFKNARVEMLPLTFVYSGMREPLACRSASAKNASVSGFVCRFFLVFMLNISTLAMLIRQGNLTPKCRLGIPGMNFLGILRHVLERVSQVPKSRFRGKMKLICWAAVANGSLLSGGLRRMDLLAFPLHQACPKLNHLAYHPT